MQVIWKVVPDNNMWIYICTFAISLLLFYLISAGKIEQTGITYFKKNHKICISRVKAATILASIPPMFIMSVRYYVGTDYFATYYSGFYRILDGSKIDGFEIGYYFLNRFMQVFTDNVFLLMAVNSIIFCWFVYSGIYVLSVDIPCSIILLLVTRYYFIGMNATRQFMAMAITLYALQFIIRNDLKKYLFFIIIATSIHYSCICFVLAYFLKDIRISHKKVVLLAGIDIAVFVLGNKFIFHILALAKYGKLLSRYQTCGLKFTIFTILLNLFILALSYTNYESRKNDIKYRTFLNIQIIAFLITLVLRTVPSMERVYWYFSFPIIVTMPYLLYGIKSLTYRKAAMFLIIALFAVYMVYDIMILNDHGVLPYQWIFGHEPYHDSGWYRYR